MIVIVLAVLILGLFAVGAALNRESAPGKGGPSVPARVKGSSLLAVSAQPLLRAIEVPGSPPANIVAAVEVPDRSRPVGKEGRGGAAGAVGTPAGRAGSVASGASVGGGQYDRQVVGSVDASQAAVIGFFRGELSAKGWDVFSTGPAVDRPGTVEVLGKKAGDDGWYWEIGALVAPTTFGNPGAPTASLPAGAEATRFTLRLFQVGDQQ
jgi:hypothetical protein